MLRTSDRTLTAEDLAAAYKQLLAVENGWRDLKSSLGLPRVIENATDDTWRNTCHEMDRMHLVTLASEHGSNARAVSTEGVGLHSTNSCSHPPRNLPRRERNAEWRIQIHADQIAAFAVNIRLLLRQCALTDVAPRVVGVGSVGTRCYVALFEDGNGNHLILQAKEAGRSVLEQYGGVTQPPELQEVISGGGEGTRVVSLQRIRQAVSGPLLGYLDQASRGFYVRQFHDMKGGIDMDELEDGPFRRYAAACGRVLARAQAQSPASGEILGFAGKGKKLSEAIIS